MPTKQNSAQKRNGRKLSPETRKKISQARKRVALKAIDQPLPVTKRCNDCGEVKKGGEDGDFYVRPGKVIAPDGRRSRYLEAYCKECCRRRTQEYRAGLDEDIRRERDRQKHARFIAKHGRDRVNEIKRFYKEKQRRDEGRERAWAKDKIGRRGVDVKADPKLPLEPFQDWIRERAAFYAERESTPSRPDGIAGLAHLARVCGLSDRTLRRYLDGWEWDSHNKRNRPIEAAPLGTVDQCLTRDGAYSLWEIYPEEKFPELYVVDEDDQENPVVYDPYV